MNTETEIKNLITELMKVIQPVLFSKQFGGKDWIAMAVSFSCTFIFHIYEFLELTKEEKNILTLSISQAIEKKLLEEAEIE